MNSLRIGGYSQTKQSSRKMCKVVVFPQIVLVDNQPIYGGVGFQRDVSLNASREFAKILYKLCTDVANKQPRGLNILDEETESKFQKSIYIEEPNCQRILFDLGKIGGGLRSDLSGEMVNAFKTLGFLKDNTQEDPAFTFLEDVTQANSQAPILWEMMYEGDLADDLQWQNFWGFKVPIAHWITGNRAKEIRLQKTFSAIHESLKFAGKETDSLFQKLAPELSHTTLLKLCQEKFDKDLLQKNQNSEKPDLADNSCQDKRWLYNHFNSGFDGNDENREFEAEKWKREIFKSIFKESKTVYDLLHFACHSEGNNTEFLSQLIMKVAGESINLDVTFIKSALKRKDSWDDNEPGPLVFLNACGTFNQNNSHEPPGFPSSWIKSQGALAVIGTICPVPDYFAYAFARKFYEVLFKAIANQDIVRECYLSEALLITRRYFMETYNNPLGLAYVLYARDGTHVLADFVRTGDAA
jgi:CHAT domain